MYKREREIERKREREGPTAESQQRGGKMMQTEETD